MHEIFVDSGSVEIAGYLCISVSLWHMNYVSTLLIDANIFIIFYTQFFI